MPSTSKVPLPIVEYDPFRRGAHPVGVRSATWNDAHRDRELPIEIWYPATREFTGADLDPDRQDTYTAAWTAGGVSEPPPVRQAAVRDAQAVALPGQVLLFCHGYAGHRRESTFICTRLASHGYVVSADHTGSTGPEVDAAMAGQKSVDMSPRRHQMGLDRKLDVPFLVAEATRRGYASEGPVGVVGCSLGGFTALIAPAVERRVRSVVPLCPAGGLSPIYPRDNELSRHLDFDWPSGVSCLQGVADRDSWLPAMPPSSRPTTSSWPSDPWMSERACEGPPLCMHRQSRCIFLVRGDMACNDKSLSRHANRPTHQRRRIRFRNSPISQR